MQPLQAKVRNASAPCEASSCWGGPSTPPGSRPSPWRTPEAAAAQAASLLGEPTTADLVLSVCPVRTARTRISVALFHSTTCSQEILGCVASPFGGMLQNQVVEASFVPEIRTDLLHLRWPCSSSSLTPFGSILLANEGPASREADGEGRSAREEGHAQRNRYLGRRSGQPFG